MNPVLKFRLYNDWSQMDLARRTLLSVGTINRIEKGQGLGGVKVDSIQRLAREMDTTPGALLDLLLAQNANK